MTDPSLYYDFAGILALCALLGAAAVQLRQPPIIGFIAAGILAGPALGFVSSHGQIELLAEIGVTVLLFVVGLRLDVHLVRNLGSVALASGLGQLALTTALAYLICLPLGLRAIEAAYVSVALAFSSTIIVVKLLSDKREIDSLHGRIALGILIVQDIAVVVAMMLLGAQKGAAADGAGWAVLNLVLRMSLALMLVGVLMRYVLARLVHFLARSQELLLVFAVAWGVMLATAGELIGFSKEVGALLAGFSLATTAYREAMSARLTSVRDFLLLFFFVNLGAKLELSGLRSDLSHALALSTFVLIGKPLIVIAIMGYMGYRKRTGFLAGLTLAQISEFSIVFVALGISVGHITDDTLGLVTLVALFTIALSSYLILYSERLYAWLAPVLRTFERTHPLREQDFERPDMPAPDTDVIVFGVGRFGRRLMEGLHHGGVRVLGVDFDPEVVRNLDSHGYAARFGDVEDPDFVQTLPLQRARWVVSTLPQVDVNLVLLASLRLHHYAGKTAVTVHRERDAHRLRTAGASVIFEPFADAANFAVRSIVEGLPKQTQPASARPPA